MHLFRAHLGLRQHEGDPAIRRMQPMADRLLTQMQHASNHVLALVVEVVEFDDIALDGGDPVEQRTKSSQIVGARAPVQLSVQVRKLPERTPVEVHVCQTHHEFAHPSGSPPGCENTTAI